MLALMRLIVINSRKYLYRDSCLGLQINVYFEVEQKYFLLKENENMFTKRIVEIFKFQFIIYSYTFRNFHFTKEKSLSRKMDKVMICFSPSFGCIESDDLFISDCHLSLSMRDM